MGRLSILHQVVGATSRRRGDPRCKPRGTEAHIASLVYMPIGWSVRARRSRPREAARNVTAARAHDGQLPMTGWTAADQRASLASPHLMPPVSTCPPDEHPNQAIACSFGREGPEGLNGHCRETLEGGALVPRRRTIDSSSADAGVIVSLCLSGSLSVLPPPPTTNDIRLNLPGARGVSR